MSSQFRDRTLGVERQASQRKWGGANSSPENRLAPVGECSVVEVVPDSNPDESLAAVSLTNLDYPLRVDLSVEHAAKRLLDLVGSFFLALVFSPVILFVVIGAAINGRSPLFRHQRVGRDGRLFQCLKFRTMVPNADEVLRHLLACDPELHAEWQRDQKLRDDPRVTPMGRLLRSTSLDELPQLWNVFKGEMSLVGPRPITREELLRYGRNAVVYMLVRPGLTGLWQVSGRNFVEYRKRVAMDVVYVRNQSLLLDLWVLVKTVRVVLSRHGAY
jgi:lipopolysaccharide/colanic/teichoic acid biosynthesis glycosyltransferase